MRSIDDPCFRDTIAASAQRGGGTDGDRDSPTASAAHRHHALGLFRVSSRFPPTSTVYCKPTRRLSSSSSSQLHPKQLGHPVTVAGDRHEHVRGSIPRSSNHGGRYETSLRGTFDGRLRRRPRWYANTRDSSSTRACPTQRLGTRRRPTMGRALISLPGLP